MGEPGGGLPEKLVRSVEVVVGPSRTKKTSFERSVAAESTLMKIK